MTKEGSYEVIAMPSHETCKAEPPGEPDELESQAMIHVDLTLSSPSSARVSGEGDEWGAQHSNDHSVGHEAGDVRKGDEANRTLLVGNGRSLRHAYGGTSRKSKINHCSMYCVTRGRSRHRLTQR